MWIRGSGSTITESGSKDRDPLLPNVDPRIQIRTNVKMRWIRNAAFKIVHGFDRVDWSNWFTLIGNNPDRVTRGTSDPLNIVRSVHNLDLRQHFFSSRVVEHWNSLPSATKSAVSVSSFKELVIPYLKSLDARLQLWKCRIRDQHWSETGWSRDQLNIQPKCICRMPGRLTTK